MREFKGDHNRKFKRLGKKTNRDRLKREHGKDEKRKIKAERGEER